MKPLGKCPWCGESVNAKILKENNFRRDQCECPKCGEKILVCRTPGCDNYAKGGKNWDDELCPECTKGIITTGEYIIVSTTVTTAITLAATTLKGSKE